MPAVGVLECTTEVGRAAVVGNGDVAVSEARSGKGPTWMDVEDSQGRRPVAWHGHLPELETEAGLSRRYVFGRAPVVIGRGIKEEPRDEEQDAEQGERENEVLS